MKKWVLDFETWDICDQTCTNLFSRALLAVRKVLEFSMREEEFVKRGGFVLMAAMSVHNKKVENMVFIQFLPINRTPADENEMIAAANDTFYKFKTWLEVRD